MGLKPYSSTSFRRSSSAAFFPFHLRKKYRAAKTIMATDTTGTTTATAMVPPADRPELEESTVSAPVPPVLCEPASPAEDPAVCEGNASVEVMRIVVGSFVLPLEEVSETTLLLTTSELDVAEVEEAVSEAEVEVGEGEEDSEVGELLLVVGVALALALVLVLVLASLDDSEGVSVGVSDVGAAVEEAALLLEGAAITWECVSVL